MHKVLYFLLFVKTYPSLLVQFSENSLTINSTSLLNPGLLFQLDFNQSLPPHVEWVQHFSSSGRDFDINWKFLEGPASLLSRFESNRSSIVTLVLSESRKQLAHTTCIWRNHQNWDLTQRCKLPILSHLASTWSDQNNLLQVTSFVKPLQAPLPRSSQYGEITWANRDSGNLFSTPGYPYDNFGRSISMHEDTAIVGAVTRDRGGLVFAFYNDGAGKFYPDPSPLTGGQQYINDFFGWSVSVYGRSVAVGAHMSYSELDLNPAVGVVYVFLHLSSGYVVESMLRSTRSQTRDNRNQDSVITPIYDNFGWSVSLLDDALVVGAYGDDDRGISSGAVYTFSRVTGAHFSWSSTQKIYAPDGAAYDAFGWSVSGYGNITAVGAYGDSTVDSPAAGSVYVFQRKTTFAGRLYVSRWSCVAKLVPSDGGTNDFFGWSVSTWDRTIVVGSRNWATAESFDGLPNGAVYTYSYSTTNLIEGRGVWSSEQKLLPPDSSTRNFGTSLSVQEDGLVVGAYGSGEVYSMDSGRAYVFKALREEIPIYEGEDRIGTLISTQWVSGKQLSPNTTEKHIEFGYSVAMWGDVALVGALLASGKAEDSGVVFSFVKSLDAASLGHPLNESTYFALILFLPVLCVAMIVVIGVARVFMQPYSTDAITDDFDESFDHSAHSFHPLSPNHRSLIELRPTGIRSAANNDLVIIYR